MRTVNIQSINVWSNGQNVPVNVLGLEISLDNLKDFANFKYALFTNYIPESGANIHVAYGYVPIEGADYQNWGTASDINLAAIQYVAGKLNLTLSN